MTNKFKKCSFKKSLRNVITNNTKKTPLTIFFYNGPSSSHNKQLNLFFC